MSVDRIFPIIVPRSYFKLGNFPGRYQLLRHPELAVTWVETHDSGWTYVNVPRHSELERQGFNVRELAIANLESGEELTTHEKVVEDKVIFHLMIHPDGLGTSRLLLLKHLDRAFPQGYWLGIPERSCGIVVPKDVSVADRQECLDFVQRCYDNGTTPMLPGLHERALFDLIGTLL